VEVAWFYVCREAGGATDVLVVWRFASGIYSVEELGGATDAAWIC